MDNEPIPSTLRDQIIERGCRYLKAVERTLDPQQAAPQARPEPTRPPLWRRAWLTLRSIGRVDA